MKDYEMLVKIIEAKETEKVKLENEISLLKRLLDLIRNKDTAGFNQ